MKIRSIGKLLVGTVGSLAAVPFVLWLTGVGSVVHADPEPSWSLAINWSGWASGRGTSYPCSEKSRDPREVLGNAEIIARYHNWKIVSLVPLLRQQPGKSVTFDGYCVIYDTTNEYKKQK